MQKGNKERAKHIVSLSESYYMDCQQARETGKGSEDKIRVKWVNEIDGILGESEAQVREETLKEVANCIEGTACIEAKDGSCLDADWYKLDAKKFNKLKEVGKE